MKKISFLILFFVLSVASIVCASETQTNSILMARNSPQVCQFSLSHYTGIVKGIRTENFFVGLSCPQETDVYATVVVVVENELVASSVVKIPAGKTQSGETSIKVGQSYTGKSYKLGVQ